MAEKRKTIITDSVNEMLYKKASQLLDEGSDASLVKAARIFDQIGDWEDAKNLSDLSKKLLTDLRNRKTREHAVRIAKEDTAVAYDEAIRILESIRGWEDADELIEEYYNSIARLSKPVKKPANHRKAAALALALAAVGGGKYAMDSGIIDLAPSEVRTVETVPTEQLTVPEGFFVSNNYYDPSTKKFITGEGSFVTDAGISYTGGFVEGVPGGNTVSTLVIKGLGTYTGSFINGKRSGEGTFLWDNGVSYTGSWKDDKMNGIGVLTFMDGSVYKGSLVQNAFEGHIDIAYANGDTYSGDVTNNQKNGNGTYTWKNGASYTGDWKDDKMNGTGAYYFTNDRTARRLFGKFENNHPQGKLNYWTDNGLVYETVWSSGTCISAEGK